MKTYSFTFSQNYKNSKINMEVEAEDMTTAVANAFKIFPTITKIHLCVEMKNTLEKL